MKIEKKKNTEIVEIQEAVKITQEGHDVLLEKGDRIEILKEASFGNILIFPVKGCKPIPDKDYDELFSRSYNGPMLNPYMQDEEAPKPWDATFSVERDELIVEGSAGASGFGSCVVKVPLPRSMKDSSYSFIIEPKSQEDFDWITQKLRSLLYELSYE